MTLMRRTLIMCVHKGWLSSEAHSRSAVSKSWPESECVLITPSPRLNLLHFLQCAINIHTAVPTHWAELIVWLKMSPRCSIKDGSVGNTVRGHYSFYLCTYMSVNILSSKTVFCFFLSSNYECTSHWSFTQTVDFNGLALAAKFQNLK